MAQPALNQQVVGNVGLYYVCYRLSLLGWNVMPTARNARGVDLLIYSQDARCTRTVQVKALSKASPVPLGGHLDHLFADFVVVCRHAAAAPPAAWPECFVLRPGEVRALAHRGEKGGKVSYWLQPKAYAHADYHEAWHRIGRGSDEAPPSEAAPERDPDLPRCQRVLAMVHELHKAGYQRLRVAPGMSASGVHWRCGVVPASAVLQSHGAMAAELALPTASYTTGMGDAYFGWTDAADDTARELAAKFVARFPAVAEAGRGPDWAYAGWYAEVLGRAERGELPAAYADWTDEAPDPRWLPTTRAVRSGLPMPPGGEAPDGPAGPSPRAVQR